MLVQVNTDANVDVGGTHVHLEFKNDSERTCQRNQLGHLRQVEDTRKESIL